MNKVAVYGSLRQGMNNHRLLTTSTFLGTALASNWTMYDLGSFPCITEGTTPITVEVYEVDATTMHNLDGLEGYPRFYDRKLINTSHGDAWIYYFHDAPTASIVPNGDWVTHYKAKRNLL